MLPSGLLQKLNDFRASHKHLPLAHRERVHAELVREIITAMAPHLEKTPLGDSIEGLLRLVSKLRTVLSIRDDLHDEYNRVSGWEKGLHLLNVSADPKKFRRIESAFYSMIECRAELLKLYEDLIETEILESLTSKLNELEEHGKKRPLSPEEIREIQWLKDEVSQRTSINE